MVFNNLNHDDLLDVRQVSRQLDECVSQLLFQRVTISLRRQTLENLQHVMIHPIYYRNVTRMTFNVCLYEDIKNDVLEYGRKIAEQLENELKILVHNACHHHRHHMSKSALHEFPPIAYEPDCPHGELCNPKMILHLQSWIIECSNFAAGRPVNENTKTAITLGQKCHRKLWTEQKELSGSNKFFELVEQALTKMPKIESVRIAAFDYPLRTSVLLDDGYNHVAFCLDRARLSRPNEKLGLIRFLNCFNKDFLKLKEVIWREPQFLSHYDHDISTPNSPLNDVETLTIQVEIESRLPQGYLTGERGPYYARLNMLPRMKSLRSLSLFGDDFRTVTQLRNIMGNAIWPNLKSLNIRNMAIKRKDLIRVCMSYAHTLTTIAIDVVQLEDATFANVANDFKPFFWRLQGFYIGNVRDQSAPDGYPRAQLEGMATRILRGRPNCLAYMFNKHKPGSD